MKKGVFITFEGTDGAGKSTLIRTLAQILEPEGHTCLMTREPGGGKLSESIRSVLIAESMDPWTELFLYEASRREHVQKVIRPALHEKKIVLCDRYADSSIAYQGVGRGLPLSKVSALNRLATGGLYPDLTVWLDVPVERALERVREHTRFEAEGRDFQARVRKGFAKARAMAPKRWLVLKVGSQTPDELAKRVFNEMKKRRLIS